MTTRTKQLEWHDVTVTPNVTQVDLRDCDERFNYFRAFVSRVAMPARG